ncbi:FG-GAP repeat domain-containing protein [Pseudooceanicola sp.]|uniref:FG-GAP repeat domain-containing protein n=1 Tax=Pseudooceanicola sp. TaxID=1914328 RepID=UPI0035C71E81
MRDRARPVMLRAWRPMARRALLAAGLCLTALSPVQAEGRITAATYEGPTDRYDHGVLGDKLEWTTLRLTLEDGTVRRFTLPEDMVFEDLSPRLADVTGDGVAEVIAVETSLRLGARLAVYTAEGRLVTTDHIGQRNRWLAPVGAADFDGDGRIEIAFVDRPHLLQMLRLVRLEAGELREVATLRGVTNHRLGWDYIVGGVRHCAGRPEIILSTGDWLANLSVFWSRDQRLDTRAEGRFTGPESLEKLIRCET